MTSSRVYLAVIGLLYLGTGFWCAIKPKETMNSIGLEATNGSGSSEYVTVYGGLQVGLGIFYLLCGWHPGFATAGLIASVATHGGIILFRGASLTMYSGVKPLTYGLATFELFLLAVGALLLWFQIGKSMDSV